MLPCTQCSKDVSFESALLAQDLNAEPLAFCSEACQDLWLDELFKPALQRRSAA
jgi:hypothetical protein